MELYSRFNVCKKITKLSYKMEKRDWLKRIIKLVYRVKFNLFDDTTIIVI